MSKENVIVDINKVQTNMLNKAQQNPLKKQTWFHLQQECHSQILDYYKNHERYLVLD